MADMYEGVGCSIVYEMGVYVRKGVSFRNSGMLYPFLTMIHLGKQRVRG